MKSSCQNEKLISKVGFYTLEDGVVGSGQFSVVRKAHHSLLSTTKFGNGTGLGSSHSSSSSNQQVGVAIKIVNKTKLDKVGLKNVKREIDVLRSLERHQHVITLYQVMESQNHIYMVTEYACNGELFDHIVKHGRMDEFTAIHVFTQIISAVNHIHECGFVHRDLKVENLLLDGNKNVKLVDFGFATKNTNKDGGGKETSDNDNSGVLFHSTWCGSPPYAAPELFEGRKGYDGVKVDIWSLGVILYVLVTGSLPFDGTTLHELKMKILTCQYRIPFFVSLECESLLRMMLVYQPSKRATLSQIANHIWFSKLRSKMFMSDIRLLDEISASNCLEEEAEVESPESVENIDKVKSSKLEYEKGMMGEGGEGGDSPPSDLEDDIPSSAVLFVIPQLISQVKSLFPSKTMTSIRESITSHACDDIDALYHLMKDQPPPPPDVPASDPMTGPGVLPQSNPSVGIFSGVHHHVKRLTTAVGGQAHPTSGSPSDRRHSTFLTIPTSNIQSTPTHAADVEGSVVVRCPNTHTPHMYNQGGHNFVTRLNKQEVETNLASPLLDESEEPWKDFCSTRDQSLLKKPSIFQETQFSRRRCSDYPTLLTSIEDEKSSRTICPANVGLLQNYTSNTGECNDDLSEKNGTSDAPNMDCDSPCRQGDGKTFSEDEIKCDNKELEGIREDLRGLGDSEERESMGNKGKEEEKEVTSKTKQHQKKLHKSEEGYHFSDEMLNDVYKGMYGEVMESTTDKKASTNRNCSNLLSLSPFGVNSAANCGTTNRRSSCPLVVGLHSTSAPNSLLQNLNSPSPLKFSPYTTSASLAHNRAAAATLSPTSILSGKIKSLSLKNANNHSTVINQQSLEGHNMPFFGNASFALRKGSISKGTPNIFGQ